MKDKLEAIMARWTAQLNRTQMVLTMLGLTGIALLSFLQTVIDQILLFYGAKWHPLMLVSLLIWAVSYIGLALVFNVFKRRYPNARESEDE